MEEYKITQSEVSRKTTEGIMQIKKDTIQMLMDIARSQQKMYEKDNIVSNYWRGKADAFKEIIEIDERENIDYMDKNGIK